MPLLQKTTDCLCPDEFALPILTTLPGSLEMSGCTMCGRACLANPDVSEDRPHDVQFHGYVMRKLSKDARTWAGAWPRHARNQFPLVFLPATARFTTESELNAAIAAARHDQASLTLREKLLRAGIPAGEPPPSLPKELAGFVEIWHGLDLNDATPLDTLLREATRWNGPKQLASDILARRTDLRPLAIGFLSDEEDGQRSHGRYLVDQFHLSGTDILEPLCRRLDQLKDTKSGEMYGIYEALRKMGAAATSAVPALEAAAKRIEKADYYTHKDYSALIQRLKDGGPFD